MTNIEMAIVSMPGRVYSLAFDPEVSGYPAEMGWPEPRRTRVGTGYRYRYDVSSDVAEDMIRWAKLCGEGLLGGGGPEENRDAKVLIQWADNMAHSTQTSHKG